MDGINCVAADGPIDCTLTRVVAAQATKEVKQLAAQIEGLKEPNATAGLAVEGHLMDLMAIALATFDGSQVAKTPVASLQSGNDTQNIQLLVAAMPVTVNTQDPSGIVAPRQPPLGFPLAQQLPAEALLRATQVLGANFTGQSQIGLTTCYWTGLNPYGPAIVTDPVTKKTEVGVDPVGQGVSLSLISADGKKVTVENLVQPIVIVVPTRLSMQKFTQDDFETATLAGQELSCRWFNETTRAWVTDGCRVLSIWKDGSELLCACTHLTTFAAFPTPVSTFFSLALNVTEGFVQFLIYQTWGCARLEALFTAEGWAAVTSNANDWENRLSAGWFYFLLFLVAFGVLFGLYLDWLAMEDLQTVWTQMNHIPVFSMSRALRRSWSYMWSPCQWLEGIIRDIVETHVALRLGVCQATLQTIEEAQKECPEAVSECGLEKKRLWFSLEAKIVKAANLRLESQQEALEELLFMHLSTREGEGAFTCIFFTARRIGKLLLKTFAAGHPVAFLLLRDVWTLQSHRAMVLAVQFVGSIFCSALYFKESGTAVTSHSDPECYSADLLERIQTSIPVSAVCLLVSMVPASLMYNMISTRPKSSGQRPLSTLLCNGAWFLLGLLLVSFSFFYLAAFLANVHEQSARLWVVAAGCSLAMSLIVSPGLQAVFYTMVAVTALRTEPSLAVTMFQLQLGPQSEDKPLDAEQGDGAPGATGARRIVVRPSVGIAVAGPCLPGQVEDAAAEDFSMVVPGV